jgi:hypothetical protein
MRLLAGVLLHEAATDVIDTVQDTVDLLLADIA